MDIAERDAILATRYPWHSSPAETTRGTTDRVASLRGSPRSAAEGHVEEANHEGDEEGGGELAERSTREQSKRQKAERATGQGIEGGKGE